MTKRVSWKAFSGVLFVVGGGSGADGAVVFDLVFVNVLSVSELCLDLGCCIWAVTSLLCSCLVTSFDNVGGGAVCCDMIVAMGNCTGAEGGGWFEVRQSTITH